ncbi:hypothetical protein SeMB42_g05932 [Synchytrium endobioticum]|uniref:Protein LTV1 n=1 Tax=Synchytrium endobioticum TaxID=286115 RepID=A0A507CN84_9FUNG|nr:hypothetical protein SeMB42_g05932 [Synchytrium endobioticum]
MTIPEGRRDEQYKYRHCIPSSHDGESSTQPSNQGQSEGPASSTDSNANDSTLKSTFQGWKEETDDSGNAAQNGIDNSAEDQQQFNVEVGSISSSELSFVMSVDSRASLLSDDDDEEETEDEYDHEEEFESEDRAYDEEAISFARDGTAGSSSSSIININNNSRSRSTPGTSKVDRIRSYTRRTRLVAKMGDKRHSFIDKKTARTFQVVHRSQRDPALSDETASRFVLREVPPSSNLLKRGKYQPDLNLADLDEVLEHENEYDSENDKDCDEEQHHLSENADDEALSSIASEGKEIVPGINPIPFDDEDDEWEDLSDQEEPSNAIQAVLDDQKGEERPVETISVDKGDDVSVYGIFFEDQDTYDYTRHLKPIGQDTAAVYVSAASSGSSKKPSSTSTGGIAFIDEDAANAMNEQPSKRTSNNQRHVSFILPSDVLPSHAEDEVGLLNRGNAPSGLQLELDPDVREALEALEDEPYVVTTGDETDEKEDVMEGWFATLNADALPEGMALGGSDEDDHDEESGWMREFRKYKKQQHKVKNERADSCDEYSDDQPDYKSNLTSQFSMSSSSIYRNPNKVIIDDRFDRVLEQEYSDNEIGELDADDPSVRGAKDVNDARMNKLMNEFLDSVELRGKRHQTLISKRDGVSQLREIREELREGITGVMHERNDGQERDEVEVSDTESESHRRGGWDAESIISTYSNVYHRPQVIDEDDGVRIRVNRHGIVTLVGKGIGDRKSDRTLPTPPPESCVSNGKTEEGKKDEPPQDDERLNRGQARPKLETAEEKRTRKEAVKAERRERREMKKSTKAEFKQAEATSKRQYLLKQSQRRLHIE